MNEIGNISTTEQKSVVCSLQRLLMKSRAVTSVFIKANSVNTNDWNYGNMDNCVMHESKVHKLNFSSDD